MAFVLRVRYNHVLSHWTVAFQWLLDHLGQVGQHQNTAAPLVLPLSPRDHPRWSGVDNAALLASMSLHPVQTCPPGAFGAHCQSTLETM